MISSSKQRCTRWAAHGAGSVELCEDETLPSQLADVRSVACWVLKITITKLFKDDEMSNHDHALLAVLL